MGLKAGANVVMPNLSPTDVRALYALYENKICTGEEAAQCIGCLRRRIESAGYRVAVGPRRREAGIVRPRKSHRKKRVPQREALLRRRKLPQKAEAADERQLAPGRSRR